MLIDVFIKELLMAKDYYGNIDIIDFIIEKRPWFNEYQKSLKFILRDRWKPQNESYSIRIEGRLNPGFMDYEQTEVLKKWQENEFFLRNKVAENENN